MVLSKPIATVSEILLIHTPLWMIPEEVVPIFHCLAPVWQLRQPSQWVEFGPALFWCLVLFIMTTMIMMIEVATSSWALAYVWTCIPGQESKMCLLQPPERDCLVVMLDDCLWKLKIRVSTTWGLACTSASHHSIISDWCVGNYDSCL